MFPIAVIASMVVIISAATLVARGLSSMAGSARTTSDNEARDAAEAGIELVVGRLNQPVNRQLMLAAVPMGQWGSSSDPTIADQLSNPCSPPTGNPGTPITSSDFGIGGGYVALPGSGNRQFRLLGLTVRGPRDLLGSRPSFSSTPSSSSSSGGYTDQLINLDNRANTGELELVVEGISDTVGSTSQVKLRRVFELVPKMCGLSFGRSADDIGAATPAVGLWSHGNDFRYSLPGLVIGLAGGGLSNSGGDALSLVRLNDDGSPNTNTPPTQPASVLCLVASSGNTCGNAANGINGVPVLLKPDLAGFSAPTSTVPGWLDTSVACTGARCLGRGAKNTIRVNAAGTNVEKVDFSKSPLTPSTFPDACKLFNGAFHCRIDALNENTKYEIDTSRAPIYLYYGAWSSPTPQRFTGTGGIAHYFCPTPKDTIQCTTKPDNLHLARAGVISVSTTPFEISLDGNSGMTNLLLSLPNGTLSATGNSKFYGVAFLNNLTLNGNASLAIPTPYFLDPNLAWLGDSDLYKNAIRRLGMAVYEVVARRGISSSLVSQ